MPQEKPEFQKGKPEVGQPSQLPQGAADELNNMLEKEPDFEMDPDDLEDSGDLTEFDDILFSASDYPDEPITEGAPFGPGANSMRGMAPETDDEFMTRAAAAIAGSPSASSRVKSFVTRVANGE